MVQIQKKSVKSFHNNNQKKLDFLRIVLFAASPLLLGVFILMKSNVIFSNDGVKVYTSTKIRQLQLEDQTQHGGGGGGGLCPELVAAARYVASQPSAAAAAALPHLKVRMVQLVGQWEPDGYSTGDVMYQVFTHNAKIVENHGFEAVAVTEPLSRLSPPYWKMKAVLKHCRDDVDVLWFLDGDVILLEPTVRVDVLWYYHMYWAQQEGADLDVLFSVDYQNHNAGVFLVNCQSPSALEFIKLWDETAEQSTKKEWTDDLAIRHLGWYEQASLHYLLDTKFWQQLNTTKTRSVSDHALRQLHKRIRTTSQSCSLYSQNIDFFCNAEVIDTASSELGSPWYEPGQFAVHTAGIRMASIRTQYFRDVLKSWNEELPEPLLSIQQAATNYLNRHEGRKSIDPLLNRDFDVDKCMHEIEWHP